MTVIYADMLIKSWFSENEQLKLKEMNANHKNVKRITVLSTPVGKIGVITENDRLWRVLLPNENPESMQDDLQFVEPDSDAIIREVLHYIKQYFKREPVSWAGKYIPEGSPFFKKVWEAATKIPFGETVTYGELAQMAGRPMAARAAGSAMANNPLPLLIPCHRVIASNGSLGGFGGGLNLKRKLLIHEGVKV